MSIRDILMTDQLMLAAWNMKGKPSKNFEILPHLAHMLEHVSQSLDSVSCHGEGELSCGQENSASSCHGVESSLEQTVATGQNKPCSSTNQRLPSPASVDIYQFSENHFIL